MVIIQRLLAGDTNSEAEFNTCKAIIEGIPMRLMDYLELVDWTGRQLRKGKTRYIESHTPPILQRLNFEQQNWLKACTQF
ncbi:hypothetical protein L4D76_04065 [Photobacterium sagamiensis]|uniref:hypothetical protein n=1 Tax=Photobacterium sagamiensis TaxID=2910241 RepID=UPI003D127775